jgi:hypothetical protein
MPVGYSATFVVRGFTVAEKDPDLFAIPSGVRNLPYFSAAKTAERFLAPLGMTRSGFFPQTV